MFEMSKPSSEELPIGLETMSPAMRDMECYPRYLLGHVLPYLGNRVWEIGVGSGQYTRHLLALGKQVLGTDIDPKCLLGLRETLQDDSTSSLTSLHTAVVDLTDRDSIFAQADFCADSVVCFNVLEHIEDHRSALEWIRQSVERSAVLALIVPAHPMLYGQMDREAGHFRRYTRASAMQVLLSSGWQVERCQYINWIGGVGWWYHNRVRSSAGLKDAKVNQQVKSIDRWLPRFARFTDPLLKFVGGLSVLVIARNAKLDGEVSRPVKALGNLSSGSRMS